MKASANVRITTTPAQRTIVRKALATFEDTGLLPSGLTSQVLESLATSLPCAGARIPSKMLTRRQVAEHLSVSYRTVQNFEAQGLLKPVRFTSKLGGAVRFNSEDVVRLQAGDIRHG